MKLPVDEFCEAVDYAEDQEAEDKLRLRWMIAGQHLSYSDFKKELTPPKFKSDKALMEDTLKILEAASNGTI